MRGFCYLLGSAYDHPARNGRGLYRCWYGTRLSGKDWTHPQVIKVFNLQPVTHTLGFLGSSRIMPTSCFNHHAHRGLSKLKQKCMDECSSAGWEIKGLEYSLGKPVLVVQLITAHHQIFTLSQRNPKTGVGHQEQNVTLGRKDPIGWQLRGCKDGAPVCTSLALSTPGQMRI